MNTCFIIVSLVGAAIVTASCSDQKPSASSVTLVTKVCTDCSVTAWRVTVIDGATSPELAGRPRSVAVDRLGRVFLSTGSRDIPSVFDSTGHFIAKPGRKGSGPGELERVFWIDAGRDDSVRVYASPLITVFDAELKFARLQRQSEVIIGTPALMEFLSDGKVALQHTSPDVTTRQYTTRILDALGVTLTTLSLQDSAKGLEMPQIGAARDDGHFWGVRMLGKNRKGYEVLLYRQDGTVVRTLEREPAWWVARPEGSQIAGAAFSRPLFVAEDSAGKLIVVVGNPKLDWNKIPATGGGFSERHDGLVEVLDPVTSRVVGSVTIEGWPVRLGVGERVVTSKLVADQPLVAVWRIKIHANKN